MAAGAGATAPIPSPTSCPARNRLKIVVTDELESCAESLTVLFFQGKVHELLFIIERVEAVDDATRQHRGRLIGAEKCRKVHTEAGTDLNVTFCIMLEVAHMYSSSRRFDLMSPSLYTSDDILSFTRYGPDHFGGREAENVLIASLRTWLHRSTRFPTS